MKKLSKNRKIQLNNAAAANCNISDRARQSIASAINFETLETRELMTALSITSYGAVSGSNATAAFQAALNAAKPGDTVNVPAGTFNITGSLNVPSGVTITGLGSNSSHVDFTLSNTDYYGFVLNGNDANVTISNLDLHSSRGLIGMSAGSGYNNIHITNDALQYGGGTTTNGTMIFGIYGSVSFPGLQITHNYFHDSLTGNRNFEIWNASNANIDYNTYYNIPDGGHIDSPGDNVSYSYNYGTNIRRMGVEIQGDNVSHNLKVVGNTFYNWITPYYDSFGMSVVNHNAINTLIADNYLGATIAPGSTWGIKDPNTNRFGYAIEIGAQSATVENNIMTGQWVAGVVSSRVATVENNNAYGSYSWGTYIGEGGLDGVGKETLINNQQNLPMSSAPAAPADTNDFTGNASDSSGGTTTTPVVTTPVVTTPVVTTPIVTTPVVTTPVVTTPVVTTPVVTTPVVTTPVVTTPTTTTSTDTGATGLSGLTAVVLSDNSVKLSWTTSATLTSATVDIITTVGRQSFSPVTVDGNVASVTISNLHSGWQFDFSVTGTAADGSTVKSGIVTAQTTGSSALAMASSPDAIAMTTVANQAGPVAGSVSNVSATVLSDSSVLLSWVDTDTDQVSAQIGIITTVGREVYPTISVSGGVTTATITGLHAGWQFDFTVTITNSAGKTMTGGPITVMTTGSSTAVTNALKLSSTSSLLAA